MRGLQFKNFEVVNERYKIIRLLATGGEGYVYLAQDLSSGSQACVIKQMFQSPSELKGIEEDYQLFSGLFHPNIVQVLDFFWYQDIFFVVMNYLAGQTMKQYLNKHGQPLEEIKALRWMERLARILDFLHSRPTPIIHADIAPDNIVVTNKEDLVIIDFGIARSSFEAVGLREGYSAPEQLDGLLDTSCDVYSLGATLYKCLTLRDQPEPGFDPRNDNPNISSSTAQLIKKSTAKSKTSMLGLKKERYLDMEEFLEGVSNCFINQ